MLLKRPMDEFNMLISFQNLQFDTNVRLQFLDCLLLASFRIPILISEEVTSPITDAEFNIIICEYFTFYW